MLVIEDSIHAEQAGRFQRFDEAVAELRRRAAIPWDEEPNRAPCTSWRSCGREYHVLAYDTSETPWKLLKDVGVLNVSATGIEWVEGFETVWLTDISVRNDGNVAAPGKPKRFSFAVVLELQYDGPQTEIVEYADIYDAASKKVIGLTNEGADEAAAASFVFRGGKIQMTVKPYVREGITFTVKGASESVARKLDDVTWRYFKATLVAGKIDGDPLRVRNADGEIIDVVEGTQFELKMRIKES